MHPKTKPAYKKSKALKSTQRSYPKKKKLYYNTVNYSGKRSKIVKHKRKKVMKMLKKYCKKPLYANTVKLPDKKEEEAEEEVEEQERCNSLPKNVLPTEEE
jgi:L-2-hydroxyglutarate oxidase LhgO